MFYVWAVPAGFIGRFTRRVQGDIERDCRKDKAKVTQRYFLRKRSRIGNIPYAGRACEAAGVEPGKIYDNKEEAGSDAHRLSLVNPVGFEVVEYKEERILP